MVQPEFDEMDRYLFQAFDALFSALATTRRQKQKEEFLSCKAMLVSVAAVIDERASLLVKD